MYQVKNVQFPKYLTGNLSSVDHTYIIPFSLNNFQLPRSLKERRRKKKMYFTSRKTNLYKMLHTSDNYIHAYYITYFG